MSKKQAITTSLIRQSVMIGEVTATQSGPPTDAANRVGEIANVYYDRDGDIKYTVKVINTGKLIELYPSSFTCICEAYAIEKIRKENENN